ncbi:MAG: acetyltransferase [Gammaproteobacteria bacterium]|nr:acetyltransferase [Gammaproteobacteria bacterium]MCW8840698.1 acetyltransferase [Gammaproteobacteria bacterium]MCW8959451.1 acetyltransferase [Gammaproteobacteria bacterium]MCW8972530.1 acetyltransferase [Gammaproteobacteria bacterium]MCW8993142.1 acetyltransferase [Gammaproteobacteria bacterium]
MSHYDVFNGDADGLCALQQLRLENPIDDAVLVTGVKRDIALLQQVTASAGDTITVLDISLDKNREALESALAAGASVDYFDHHFAGEIPQHPKLTTHIDTSPEICTSLLVNDSLQSARLAWAVAGAYGDNFHDAARAAAAPLGLNEQQLEALCELGTLLNYNGYGNEVADLFFHPRELALKLRPYANPFAFIAHEPAYQALRQGYADDMARVDALEPELADDEVALFIMPDAPWSRRVSGVYGNLLARNHPQRAHAILTALEDGAFRVSIRAPLTRRTGADTLCREFPSGGGRAAAAGINRLEAGEYGHFIDRFAHYFRC